MRRGVAALAALALTGCLPDLSAWQVVQAGVDAGQPPDTDGGTPGQPNPLELGVPCPDPHLAMGTIADSSETARLIRIDPATGALCRNSAVLEVQRSFGYAIVDVEWHPDTGLLLGLPDAVLAMDGEGFPRWRYQPFSYAIFEGEWLAVFGAGSSQRIAVAWSERSSSSIDGMALLDTQGRRIGGEIEPPFFGAMIAAHPAGDGRVLIPSRAGADIDVYVVSDTATSVHDSTATPLWTGAADLPATYGYRQHLATDLTAQRLVITHQDGIALWTVGAPPPSTVMACPSYCGSFHAAAPDPNASDGAYAICVASATSARHLVHLRGGTCSLVLDGTSLGSHRLQDITLVRAAL